MIHASGLCCVGLGMRSGAPWGTEEVVEGVSQGAACGSGRNERGGERGRATKRCTVLELEWWMSAGTCCSEMGRLGTGSVLVSYVKGRLRPGTARYAERWAVICGARARVIGRFLVGTCT